MNPYVTVSGEQGKGAVFRLTLVAHVVADALWDCGNTDSACRPALAVLACSHGDAQPVLANLRLGRRAAEATGRGSKYSTDHPERFEFPKSAGFTFTTQRHPEGVLVTAHQASVFRLDPGMVDPSGVRFAVLPPRAWAGRQVVDAAPVIAAVSKLYRRRAAGDYADKPKRVEWLTSLSPADQRELVVTACLFAAYLDRRTHAPVPQDPRFWLAVLLECLGESALAYSSAEYLKPAMVDSWGHERRVNDKKLGLYGLADAGYLPGVVVSATHEQVREVVARVVESGVAA